MKYSALLSICFLAKLSLATVENINLARDEVTCDGTRYTKGDIQLAANTASGHHNNGSEVGQYPPPDTRNYPHHFSNFDGVNLAPNCDKTQLEEFPLTRTVPYTGGTPGTQRVAVNYVNAVDVRLCAVMFHRQSDKNWLEVVAAGANGKSGQ
ncbi:hypothetical protein CNMCM6457_001792 [Aspergillus fumigatiaffinis]|nr:hypothetical protein CNMCM6457_001792 [Aspergillus fumigatiaffinis]